MQPKEKYQKFLQEGPEGHCLDSADIPTFYSVLDGDFSLPESTSNLRINCSDYPAVSESFLTDPHLLMLSIFSFCDARRLECIVFGPFLILSPALSVT